jgi:hypothetical protein
MDKDGNFGIAADPRKECCECELKTPHFVQIGDVRCNELFALAIVPTGNRIMGSYGLSIGVNQLFKELRKFFHTGRGLIPSPKIIWSENKIVLIFVQLIIQHGCIVVQNPESQNWAVPHFALFVPNGDGTFVHMAHLLGGIARQIMMAMYFNDPHRRFSELYPCGLRCRIDAAIKCLEEEAVAQKQLYDRVITEIKFRPGGEEYGRAAERFASGDYQPPTHE